MSKKNDDFFTEKKLWSTIKDELLGCYLKPYVSKIIHTRKPVMTTGPAGGFESP